MRLVIPLAAVAALALIVYAGVEMMHLQIVFGVLIPYLAVALFLFGFSWRLWKWASSPVPFNITTTAGQQKSLPWIRNNNFENPHNKFGAIVRVALEVLVFRSLFRNTKAMMQDGKLTYKTEPVLWLAGLLFHWSFFIILVRHLRFFSEPMFGFLHLLESADGLLQVGVPTFYLTDLTFLLGVTLLFARRVIMRQIRYISLVADFFPLFLLLGIGLSGTFMRYSSMGRVDVIDVKTLALSLASFSLGRGIDVLPDLGAIFYVHLTFISVLFAYFPFSKLMHMGGIFLSPTRNMPNDSRINRHINPWNPEVKFQTYAKYEDEYRKFMKSVDLPLEKDED